MCSKVIQVASVWLCRGEPKAGLFAPGVDLRAKVTLLAEGARGSVTQEAVKKLQLRQKGMHAGGAEPQTYALGVKEVGISWPVGRLQLINVRLSTSAFSAGCS